MHLDSRALCVTEGVCLPLRPTFGATRFEPSCMSHVSSGIALMLLNRPKKEMGVRLRQMTVSCEQEFFFDLLCPKDLS